MRFTGVWMGQDLDEIFKLLLWFLRRLLMLFKLIFVGDGRSWRLNWLWLIPVFLNWLLLKLLGVFSVSLHRVDFLALNNLILLLLDEVVLRLEFLVEVWAYSREFKCFRDVPSFKSLSYLLFEHYQFIFHFWVNVSFFIGWPKSPKSITFDVALFRFLLNTKNVFPKLLKDILSL